MRWFPGLLLVLMTIAPAHAEEDFPLLRQGFARLDLNEDQKLSPDEIQTAPRLGARLSGADEDEDGFVSFEEFSGALIRSVSPPETVTQDELKPGEQVRTVQVGELERRYLLYVPTSLDPEKDEEVVLIFHGGGGNPESMVHISRMNEKADEAGFLAVYPYGTGLNPDRQLTFNGGECCGYAMNEEVDDVAFAEALLDDLSSVAKVDAGAVFATGLSNGGIVSYRLGAELADRIAAIAPVGGPLMLESISPSRPVAVMHFHGTDDAFAPFDGGYGQRPVTDFHSVDFSIQNWVKANGCEAEPTTEMLPDAADDGTRVTRKIWGNGREETEVVLLEIEGGGHTWPGVPARGAASFLGVSTEDISANDLMWEFFQKHRRTE